MEPLKTDSSVVASKLIVKARLHSSIRNSGPVSFAISIDGSTTIRAVKMLILQKAQKAPGAPEWNAPSSPSAFLLRLNDTVPLVNEDVPVITRNQFSTQNVLLSPRRIAFCFHTITISLVFRFVCRYLL